MKQLAGFLLSIFICMVGFYFFVLKPGNYTETDLYEEIMARGFIKVGIKTDSKPFGFVDQDGNYQGYDADLARYIAQYLLKNQNRVIFIPVTPSNRIIKASTREVDIVIATMTITPQRQEILD